MKDYFENKVRRIISLTLWSFAAFLVVVIFVLFFIPVEESIATHGIVTFEKSYRIYSPDDGFVSEINKREGDAVKKGEVILKLDERDARQLRNSLADQVEEAKATLRLMSARLEQAKITPLAPEHRFAANSVKEAEAKLAFSDAEYARRQTLRNDGVESQSNVEKAKLDADIARQGLDRAQKQVSEVGEGLAVQNLLEAEAQQKVAQTRIHRLESDLRDMNNKLEILTVRAPSDGVVSYLAKRESDAPVKRGELLAHVGAGPSNRIILESDDFKAHRVKPGQQVRLQSAQINALLEGYVRGEIVEVGVEKNRADDSSEHPQLGLEVDALVTSTPVKLVPGTQVSGFIVLGHKSLWKVMLRIDR